MTVKECNKELIFVRVWEFECNLQTKRYSEKRDVCRCDFQNGTTRRIASKLKSLTYVPCVASVCVDFSNRCIGENQVVFRFKINSDIRHGVELRRGAIKRPIQFVCCDMPVIIQIKPCLNTETALIHVKIDHRIWSRDVWRIRR